MDRRAGYTMTFRGACQNAADVPRIGGRRQETCRRRGGRIGVVCYMRYIELGGAVQGGSGGGPFWRL
jgi:hypothetical protein